MPRTIGLLDLAPRDDVFYGDGALRQLGAELERLGHATTLWHSVRASHPRGEAAWTDDVRRFVQDGGFDVVVVSRAWERSLVDALREGLREGGALVRFTDGTRAALDDCFDHVVDRSGLLALVEGAAVPEAPAYGRTNARALREGIRQLPIERRGRVERVGSRWAIAGPSSGCPYMRDARGLPAFEALALDPARVQTKGCTFCLDQTGSYVDAGEEATVGAWLDALAEVRAAEPGVREVLLVDERPHPYLPALFRAIAERPALHGLELLLKSRVDWLLEFAEGALSEACALAERSGSVVHLYLVGFESFDAMHLSLFNKGVSVDDNLRAIDVLRALGARFPRSFEYLRLRAHGFVAFTPWTTPESLLENARRIRASGFEALRAEAHRTRLRLYPRTPLHALAASQGLLGERHDEGRGDRAAEQGYDASVPWRFADPRTEAVFRTCAALREHDRRIGDADLLELASRWILRHPELAAVPDDAHRPLLRALATFRVPASQAIARLGGAAVLDAELDGILRGRKAAALKELVPRAEVEGLVRAHRAMGFASAEVEAHALDANGNRHRRGDDHAIVAVARDEATLAEVLRHQRARDVPAMGALMGYPPCCVAAFEAQPDRGDNLENERLPFRRHPDEALAPLLSRLGPVRIGSHHPCSPACAPSVALAEAFLADVAELDADAAARIRADLGRSVLAIDHETVYLLDGGWESERFRIDAYEPVGRVAPLPEGTRALELSGRQVRWLDAEGAELLCVAADRPLLVTPGERLADVAFDAIGGRAKPPLRWIELTPDYRCNNRCVGCFSVDDDGPSMRGGEIAAALARGRRTGASWLWLGGGEPTMRKDLFPIVREARRLGYDRVRIQTNGMMLGYDEFARRAAEAGITEASLSIKGARAETHDAYARTPGCFDRLVAATANCAAHGIALEADVLVYASNVGELPAIVRRFHELGVRRFRLWLLSAAVSGEPAVRAEVPRIAEVTAQIHAILALGLSDDPDFLVSLHTPPCTVPEADRRVLFDALAYALLVVNPGGHEFRLEESPIEGGSFLPGCSSCAYRRRCAGIRSDYLAIHGASEFVPIRRGEGARP